MSYVQFALGLNEPDQLFDHFLIDVQMGSCMMTSRIVQAVSSVQIFIQRCLMYLESSLDSTGKEIGVSRTTLQLPYRWPTPVAVLAELTCIVTRRLEAGNNPEADAE